MMDEKSAYEMACRIASNALEEMIVFDTFQIAELREEIREPVQRALEGLIDELRQRGWQHEKASE